jgi:carbamoyltransferase
MDGVGEWTTTSVAIGRGNELKILKEIHFPHSIGLLYSAFTYFTGFKVNSGEYKVMGLAPYGEPVFKDLILEKLVDLKADGSFRLNLEYFDYCSGLRMTNNKFAQLFGVPARKPEDKLETVHLNLAASIQAVTEEMVLRLGRSIAEETGMKNLCLAGGVALNCVANGKLLRHGSFSDIWIQPAAGDAGGALGAAYAANHLFLGQPRKPSGKDSMRGSFLGPAFSSGSAAERLKEAGARFEILADADLFKATADALAKGAAIGWMQGKMEFGPRALGARSIIADPRSEKMQSALNLKVKFRESFRPFAPAVLDEKAAEWFELDRASPYMLLVADVQKAHRKPAVSAIGLQKLKQAHSDIPAVTHVDYSARVQTVSRDTNPRFHQLLSAFCELTGCPVLINTSFNIRGEPIVNSPEDAFRCFMGTDLDALVVENCFLRKSDQDPALSKDYRTGFALD